MKEIIWLLILLLLLLLVRVLFEIFSNDNEENISTFKNKNRNGKRPIKLCITYTYDILRAQHHTYIKYIFNILWKISWKKSKTKRSEKSEMPQNDCLSFRFFFRKKRIDHGNLGETKLARVLNTLDLTALGNF